MLETHTPFPLPAPFGQMCRKAKNQKKPNNNSKNKAKPERCLARTRHYMVLIMVLLLQNKVCFWTLCIRRPTQIDVVWCGSDKTLTRVQYQGSFQPHHSTSLITIDWGSQLVTSVSSSSHIISTGPAFSSYIPFQPPWSLHTFFIMNNCILSLLLLAPLRPWVPSLHYLLLRGSNNGWVWIHTAFIVF